MAISDRNVTFRAPEDTQSQLRDIMRLFDCNQSWVLRKCVAVMWLIIFDIAKLEGFIRDWQLLSGIKRQDKAIQQLRFNFGGDWVSFYPKVSFRSEVRDAD